MPKEIKFEENPVLTPEEEQTIAIFSLEGIEVNAYNVYLSRLVDTGQITISESGHAAIQYEKTGLKKY